MSGVLSGYGQFKYTSDNTTVYQVKMQTALATAGGFTAAAGTEPHAPTGLEMRYILGKTATGQKGKLHLPTPAASLFVTPAGWTGNGGAAYVGPFGAVGEKRRAV